MQHRLTLKLLRHPRRAQTALVAALALALVCTMISLAGAEPTNSEPAAVATARPTSYQDFKLIRERNIFDPNRTRRSRPGEAEAERPRAPKIDVISLTGTMSYAKGTFAFFDSSVGDFRKTAKAGDQVAGYTVRGIEQNQVALEREGQLVELKVGQQLRREEAGEWEVTSGVAITASVNSTNRSSESESAPADGSPTAESGSGEGPSEALKRLLEQRRKEQAQ
ncbi:MAG TPA: hypothetical protein VLD18_05480 [Verrucomicrobiae bacterium]|nr:hypothetical protein [Verrucomicrobiae bacterium]